MKINNTNISNYYSELNKLSLKEQSYDEFFEIVNKIIHEIKSLLNTTEDASLKIKYESLIRALSHTNTQEVSYIKAAEKSKSKKQYQSAYDKALQRIHSDLLAL
jgi:hypothetical protein